VRILLASDLHYNLPQLDWLVGVAGEFDALVLAGDHLDIASDVPLEAQAAVILRYLELLKTRTTVVVCSGNHDLTGRDVNGEKAALWLADVRAAGIPTDGDSVEVGGVLITICPWWDGPVGRAALEEQLERDEEARGERRWVWVYHWPPADSPTTWTGHQHYGDADLRAWIEHFGPDAVLAGHVHESAFKPAGAWADRIGDTWVFNAGRQIGAEPARVEIDLDARRATWVSFLGIEEVALDGPPLTERPVFA
jgi:Icc-related predicted phosphoesterase